MRYHNDFGKSYIIAKVTRVNICITFFLILVIINLLIQLSQNTEVYY